MHTSLLIVAALSASAPGSAGPWVERPNVPELDAARASEVAALAALSGTGGTGPAWLALAAAFGSRWAWPGTAAATWAGSAAGLEPRAAQERAMSSVLAGQAARTLVHALTLPVVVASAAGAAAAVGVGAMAAVQLLRADRAQAWEVGLASVGALGLAASAALLLGTAGALASSSFAGWAQARAFQWRWMTADVADPSPAAAPVGAVARPLDESLSRALLASVAWGVFEQERWREYVPVVGPLLHATAVAGPMTEQLVHARELAGLPRTRDALHLEVERTLRVRALLLTGAALLLPAVVAGMAVAGGLLVLAAGGWVALPALTGALGVAAGGLAVVGGAVAASLWMGAMVAEGVIPHRLARMAARSNTTTTAPPPRRVIGSRT